MAEKTAFLKYTTAAILAVVFAAVAGGGVFSFFTYKKTLERKPPEHIITYEGIPPGTDLSASISMSKTEDLIADKNSFKLSDEQKKSFRLPYSIKATLKPEDNEYRDISWKLDARGVDYYIVADGFSPNDTIALILNGHHIYTVPFDWSGRIELPIILIRAENHKTCIQISSDGEKYGFCNNTTGLGKS